MLEALVPGLDRMAQRDAVAAGRKQGEEIRDLACIELFGVGELPQDRAELVAQLRQPLPQKALDRRRAGSQYLAVVQKRDAFRANLKPSGTLASHLAKVAGDMLP